MFKKLDVSLPYPIFEYAGEYVSLGESNLLGRDPPLISYNKIEGSIVQEILTLVPSEVRDKFQVSIMEINLTITPHIDSYHKCSVNYYFNAENERTVFYRVLPGKQGTPMKIDRDSGRIFTFAEVEEIDSFIAKPGEVWVLDVSKPHSLISPFKRIINRKAISLQTPHFTYDQVLEMIESRNS